MLIPELVKCVKDNKEYCCLETESAIGDAIKICGASVKFSFIQINAKMEHPVYHFWQLADADVLEDNCHVVFTNVKDSTTWKDLVDCYGGLRFGSLFLMVYRESTRVGVFPSQRGMYMK